MRSRTFLSAAVARVHACFYARAQSESKLCKQLGSSPQVVAKKAFKQDGKTSTASKSTFSHFCSLFSFALNKRYAFFWQSGGQNHYWLSSGTLSRFRACRGSSEEKSSFTNLITAHRSKKGDRRTWTIPNCTLRHSGSENHFWFVSRDFVTIQSLPRVLTKSLTHFFRYAKKQQNMVPRVIRLELGKYAGEIYFQKVHSPSVFPHAMQMI